MDEKALSFSEGNCRPLEANGSDFAMFLPKTIKFGSPRTAFLTRGRAGCASILRATRTCFGNPARPNRVQKSRWLRAGQHVLASAMIRCPLDQRPVTRSSGNRAH